VRVKLSDIYIGKRFRTETMDMKSIQDKADQFNNPEIGQLTPITIRQTNDDEKELGVTQPYCLVAGGRRTAAAYLAGWTEIEAFDKGMMSELRHRIAELYENLFRVGLSWTEEANLRAEILALRRLEDPEITQAAVAKELGESASTFSRSIDAAEALVEHPELAEASSRKAAMRSFDMIQHTKRNSDRIKVVQNADWGAGALQRDIIACDAREFLLNQPGHSIDLILTDPPFGIDYWKGGHKMRAGGPGQKLGISQFEDRVGPTMDMLADIVPLWVRSLRETGWLVCFTARELYWYLEKLVKDCCFTHADYRHEEYPGRCNLAIVNHEKDPCRFLVPEIVPWIWYRKNSRNRSRYPERHAQNKYEWILVCNMGKGRLSYPCDNVLEFDAVYGSERVHVHQKPIPLLQELVRRTTFVGDTVVDTFYGSGSHLAAASSLARRIMGCDDNENMRDIAFGMISQHFQAAPNRTPTQNVERYLVNETKGMEGVYDFEEVEVDDE
jgi:ParB/RepB/Spo0J family partition protein